MTTPVGTISLSDVNAELNFSPTALIAMNDAAVRTLAGVGGAGTVISMNDLRGKSNRVAISLTISANTNNYDVYANRGPSYNAGTSDITVTINPGITVSSTSTGSSAFSIPSSFNPGDTVTVINNGVIVGRGGTGGTGGSSPGALPPPGGSGGPALLVQRPITLQNINRVAGGGGGGGGGSHSNFPFGDGQNASCGGGGGGGGVASAPGGAGGTAPPSDGGGPGSPGGTASLSSGGSGGARAPFPGAPAVIGQGGAGGGYGSSGSGGNPGPSGNQRPGGSSGAAITGNPFITYVGPTGTRNGPVS